ncbi:MAG: TolC family protein [Planctomycetaceae bacterium]|nr:TolC family protein [Planctomycetaceae bacterium]
MRRSSSTRFSFLIVALLGAGCAVTPDNATVHRRASEVSADATTTPTVAETTDDLKPLSPRVTPVTYQTETSEQTETAQGDQIPVAAQHEAGTGLDLRKVIDSVHESYPLLQAAMFSRNIALGETISASGQFDLKLKGASENGPTGYYQTYRQSLGLQQPLYGGGEVFAGYRVGRGDFQPWYLERQTNDGGELKAGLSVPLMQNVDIDQRRADLWNAQYGRSLAEPEIRAQRIGFVQEASYAYWNWVAAGENYQIARRVLQLAEERTERIRSQVTAGLIDPPELTDNLRLVADRKAKLADSERKWNQTATKLSLFLRDSAGNPWIPPSDQLPTFPEIDAASQTEISHDITQALSTRPELEALDWQRKQIDVDYSQARNQLLPTLDAVIAGSQDVGQPTSSKRDKSEFELEAALLLDVPVQRRKARGKLTALEGKVAQLQAKRRMVADKITVDVRNARIAMEAALIQVYQTSEAVRMAEELAERERVNQQEGHSDLLKVTLREQYAAESATKAVEAKLTYFEAEADRRAAMGLDRLQ